MELSKTTLIQIDPSILYQLVDKVDNLTKLVNDMQEKEFSAMVSIKTAAELLNCSEQSIKNYNFPTYRLEGLIRYKVADIQKRIKPA